MTKRIEQSVERINVSYDQVVFARIYVNNDAA